MDPGSPTPAVELLRDAWVRHVDVDDSLLDGLVTRHREKHRRYHGVDHVASVVGHVETLHTDASITDPGAVVAAAMYHDAIYEPESRANERASARLAAKDLRHLGWAASRIERVVEMIEGTSTHLAPGDLDSATLFDADLAILGAEPGDYDDYAASVRAEYRHVNDDDWQVGRSSVLRGILDRDSIFATRSGRDRWEARARANIARELTGLA